MNAPTKPTRVMTSSEFNQNRGKAMLAAKDGPVWITHRGKPAHVLISYEEYRRLNERSLSAWDALAPSEAIDADLDIHLPERGIEPTRFSFDEEA